MHIDEPIPVENEPFVQAVQYGIPFIGATRPSSHAAHDMDPLTLENVPVGHDGQVISVVVVQNLEMYVPSPHDVPHI